MRDTRDLKTIYGRISAAGVVLASNAPISCNKTATGTYSITFPSSFRPCAITHGSMIGGGARSTDAAATMANPMTLYTFVTATQALADMAFNFIAVGY